ncbi:MAG TPA: host attachment protein [Gammaproteobacteria bacterium]|nr:host attachment protein [Gammaproteobacteria bacterium]
MAKIWVLVGDGSRARFFRTDRAAPLEELEDSLNPVAREPARALQSDRKGQSVRSGAVQYTQVGENDPKSEDERRFARSLAERLRMARLGGEYERLFIAAPPAFLGELRQALDSGTRGAVVGELPKDLSRMKPEDIRRHLPELI